MSRRERGKGPPYRDVICATRLKPIMMVCDRARQIHGLVFMSSEPDAGNRKPETANILCRDLATQARSGSTEQGDVARQSYDIHVV